MTNLSFASIIAVFFASTASMTDAFVGVRPMLGQQKPRMMAKYDKEGHHITIDAMEGEPKGVVDVERARECAEHFGKCSIEEMEQLKDNLHKERLQNFMFGGTAMTKPEEDGLEHRMLEEELELQLDLLKGHTPDPALFPNDEMENKALPHLKDATSEIHEKNTKFHKPTPSEVLQFEETVLEENLLEPFLICMVILGLTFVPTLVHNMQ